MLKKLIVVTGQTATGKTKLGLDLAKQKNGEIISADSRQLYQYLDIITGKDLDNHHFTLVKKIKNNFRIGYYLLNQVPVWLYDVVSPKEQFSAYDWAICAKEVLALLNKKSKTPIIVGGSYFYIHSLLYGYKDYGVNPDLKLRQKLEQFSVLDLQKKLQQVNPQIFNELNSSDRQNPRRLIRWLEKSFTKSQQPPLKGIVNDYKLEILGLKLSKEALTEQIKQRIQKRLQQGALAEIEILLSMGYEKTDPGLQTIGYQQLLLYLKDELSLQQAIEIWFHKENQYAKHQLTLMKKNPTIDWQVL